jgi:hypothetical protein
MLWCSEINPSKCDVAHGDVVKGNALVRTHIYAAFLSYTGSMKEAVEMYTKAKMYR